jgi:hypothetical protein
VSLLARRTLFLAVAAVPFGCDELDNFDVPVSGSAVVPPATLLDELLGLMPFDGFDEISFEQEFANQGVTEDQVDSVRVRTFALVVETPAEANLDFLEGISFFASAEGLPEIRIASAAAIPAGARSIELTVDDVELEAYATAASMVVRGEVQGKRPDVETRVRADVVFDVDVTIPGC